ncbi:MAG TPA: hypothetical protein DHV63_02795 [Pseudomonas sp.]|nr:hypothetical protein [Pseudomonas sp.]
MRIRLVVLLLGLGLALQVQGDSRGSVFVYQPNGGSYRVDSPAHRYDPRSPYSNHRQYPQNLPPRYQGQLPPQYYERHRGGQHRWNEHRRNEVRRLQQRDGRWRSNIDRPQRWQHNEPRRSGRPPLIRDRHDYRVQGQRNFNNRTYQR